MIFAFALLAILLVGSVCGNTSVDLGADVDGSSVLLESSTANDPMTGVQISGRRRIAVRKRLTPTTSQTQPSNGDEIFEPFTAEELEAMRIIAQYPAPTGQIDPALIKLLQGQHFREHIYMHIFADNTTLTMSVLSLFHLFISNLS